MEGTQAFVMDFGKAAVVDISGQAHSYFNLKEDFVREIRKWKIRLYTHVPERRRTEDLGKGSYH
jgi:hypothetical protein